ncbi:MAG: molybdate ABC transporter substrate-binding protein [Verrucomicrobiales bacterium]
MLKFFWVWLFSSLSVPGAGDIVRVSAAASLHDALKAICPEFEKQSGIRVRVNTGASNLLARQIEEGAPADLFLSADLAQTQRLARAGLVDSATQKAWLSNRLVIAVPAGSTVRIISGHDLAGTGIRRIALADPTVVPAGVYAKEWLTSIGLWELVAAKVVPTENVRAALAGIESGNVDAGIVYQSDVTASKTMKVAFEVPPAQSPKITYAKAVLKTAINQDGARKFLDYLSSPESADIFKKLGFLVLTEKGK